jgi:hypothetical protein
MRVSSQLHAQAALPPYSTEQEAGCDPEPVWEVLGGEQFAAASVVSTLQSSPWSGHYTD